MHPRILIADDHQIVRQGLQRLLHAEEDFTVVGEAADKPAGRQREKKEKTELGDMQRIGDREAELGRIKKERRTTSARDRCNRAGIPSSGR